MILTSILIFNYLKICFVGVFNTLLRCCKNLGWVSNKQGIKSRDPNEGDEEEEWIKRKQQKVI